MQHLKFVAIAMLVWGSSVFASLPSVNESSRKEIQVISSWMAHLNAYHPELQVSTSANLQDPAVRARLFNELQALEDVTYGDRSVAPHGLTELACSNVVCGDGPPGACSVCSVDGSGN